jgi:putative restriction endonuclease
MPIAGIIVARRYPQYQDKPGLLYHYPRKNYQRVVQSLLGSTVLVYEPRRGGVSPESKHGGRSSFVAVCELGCIADDPNDEGHAFVSTDNYCEFPNPVPIAESGVDGKSLERAVQVVSEDILVAIVSKGFARVVSADENRNREGLVDLAVPLYKPPRNIKRFISERPVRDVSFRYQVVDVTYNGVCAITGLRLTNGLGRAEAEAAHIMSVSAGGPDVVQNGIALSKTVHWAFDRGLVSLQDDGCILVADTSETDHLAKIVKPGTLARFPSERASRPHPVYLAWHRNNVFKGSRIT